MKYLFMSLLFISACGSPITMTSPQNSNQDSRPSFVGYGDSTAIWGPLNYIEKMAYLLNMKPDNRAKGGTWMFSQNQYQQIMKDSWGERDIIVFSPGVNDAILFGNNPNHIAAYTQAMNEIVTRLHEKGVKAYIGTPIHNCNETRFVSNAIVDIYAQINRDAVAAIASPKIKLVDFNANYIASPEMASDCIHPDNSGYVVMTGIFINSL